MGLTSSFVAGCFSVRWHKKLLPLLWLFVILLAPVHAQSDDLVNLDHLRFLTEPVTIAGQEMAVVHIYAEYPDYEWVDAAGEGLSAVDDVARAAVVYLWEYERDGDETLLELAKRCLNFVMYMQAEDGEFYNFVYDKAGTINERGGTSYKSLGWWAMRGFWSLGEGVHVFDKVDPEYAEALAAAYLKTESALGATMSNYGQYTEVHGYKIPAWIPGNEPNVAAVGLLGLAAYQQARPNETTAGIMTKIADGLAEYRPGDDMNYPFGMHPQAVTTPGFWHDWGAHVPHALVVAGMTLHRQDWIDSAAASANSFLLRHLAFERFRNIGVLPDRLNQIAYGTNMLVLAYMALYDATGDEKYAQYAGLAGSWYFGNNMAGVTMYDVESGRVFDGIDGPVSWRVNRNSGAESTIEGLMSLIALADTPAAVDLLQVKSIAGREYQILQAEDGQRVVGTPVYFPGTWTGEGYISGGRYVGIGEGQRMRIQFDIEQEDNYLLYVAHLHQSARGSTATIPRANRPPTLDGNLDDWTTGLPPLVESNTSRQFLRGAGLWKGAEVDSHAINLAWDENNLYIAARVRDPEHDQPFTLSSAGQGDTLWVYVTNNPDATRLSAKFTMAGTPDGAQLWDWLHTEFVRGGELAFLPVEGGYIYEAAIPWSSLDVETPAAGMQIGFEAGRGVGGNSFMDLTGRDPDVAANLLKLMLTEPGMAADAVAVPDIALSVRLDSEDAVLLPAMVSPDADFFWLDLVTAEPLHLTSGAHTIRYGYESEREEPNPALVKVDAFYLQPATARRTFEHPDGRTFTLSYNTVSGEITWDEGQR